MKRGLLRTGWGWKAAAIHILYIKKVRYGERKEFAKDVTAEWRICLEVLLHGCLDAFHRQRTRDKRSEWAPHRGMERASPHYSFTHGLERIPCMWQLKKNFRGEGAGKAKPQKTQR